MAHRAFSPAKWFIKGDKGSDHYWDIYVRLLKYGRPYLWPDLIISGVLLVALSASNGIIPLLIKKYIDQITAIHKVAATKDMRALEFLSILILAVWVVRAITSFTSNYVTAYIGMRVAFDMRCEFNDRLQNLPLSFFNWATTGGLLTKALSDIQASATVVTQTLFSLVGDGLTMIALVGGVFIADWRLALIAFVVFPLAIMPVIRVSKGVRTMWKDAQRKLSDVFSLMQEAIQGCRVVKAFGMEDYERARFRKELTRQLRFMRRILRISTSTNPIIEVLGAGAILAVMWYGTSAVIHGTRSAGTFGAFIAAMLLIYRPFKGIARTNSIIQQGLISAERVFETIDLPGEAMDAPGAIELGPGAHSLEFQNVTFAYDKATGAVLKDVNMKIGAGEIVALVGMSGGGKSTLADMIPRFYDPESGVILIDGVDIKKYSLKSLRAQIGLVTQSTFLFNTSIRSNITYGSPDKSLAEISHAAKLANAHDFVAKLPKGYDTAVGELGVRVSGGERQRIAIARALLKNAPILVLDEPTSNLDSEAEKVVQDAIERLMENRTTLVIAHRLSTVRRAHRILVMVDGRIVEQGSHDQLFELDREYRKLVDLQFGFNDEEEREAV
ncbi:MAG: ABC transporter ATP-binding protein [Candidatus Binataceae bacterium]